MMSLDISSPVAFPLVCLICQPLSYQSAFAVCLTTVGVSPAIVPAHRPVHIRADAAQNILIVRQTIVAIKVCKSVANWWRIRAATITWIRGYSRALIGSNFTVATVKVREPVTECWPISPAAIARSESRGYPRALIGSSSCISKARSTIPRPARAWAWAIALVLLGFNIFFTWTNISVYFAHTDLPLQFAWQPLEYVLPSLPHTGLYTAGQTHAWGRGRWVTGRGRWVSGFGTALHASAKAKVLIIVVKRSILSIICC